MSETQQLMNVLSNNATSYKSIELFASYMTNQYKQIGNAVPMNLAYVVGTSLVQLLNHIAKVESERV